MAKTEWPEIMTLKEAARYLRFTTRTIYTLLKQKELPGAKIGGEWRFRKEDLDAFIEERKAYRNPTRRRE